MSTVETGQIFAVETRWMSTIVTGFCLVLILLSTPSLLSQQQGSVLSQQQASAAETGQMHAAETRQMSSAARTHIL